MYLGTCKASWPPLFALIADDDSYHFSWCWAVLSTAKEARAHGYHYKSQKLYHGSSYLRCCTKQGRYGQTLWTMERQLMTEKKPIPRPRGWRDSQETVPDTCCWEHVHHIYDGLTAWRFWATKTSTAQHWGCRLDYWHVKKRDSSAPEATSAPLHTNRYNRVGKVLHGLIGQQLLHIGTCNEMSLIYDAHENSVIPRLLSVVLTCIGTTESGLLWQGHLTNKTQESWNQTHQASEE